jgi:hypothetical protein
MQFRQMEILDDSQLIIDGHAMGYSILPDNRLAIQVTSGISLVYTFSREGDRISLTNAQGDSCEMRSPQSGLAGIQQELVGRWDGGYSCGFLPSGLSFSYYTVELPEGEVPYELLDASQLRVGLDPPETYTIEVTGQFLRVEHPGGNESPCTFQRYHTM